MQRSSVGGIYIDAPHFAKCPDLKEAHLLFIPSPDVSNISLALRFLRINLPDMKPKLHTQLNAFRFVDRGHGHHDLIADGTIQQIDSAIRNGLINPYDQFLSGRNVCYWVSVKLESVPVLCSHEHQYAGRYLRLDLLQYFQSQGMQLTCVK